MGGLFLKIEVNSIYEHQLFSRKIAGVFSWNFVLG